MSVAFYLMLMLPTTWSEDIPSPSKLQGPRDFNYHPYQAEQYLREVEPTKKGPVMFPNDGPPPPKPPLIVTSRPLIESILKSELYQPVVNNSLPSSSQLNHVTFRPTNYPQEYDSNPEYSKFKPDFTRFKPAGQDHSKFKPDIDNSKPHFRLKPEYLKQVVLGQTKDYKPFVYPFAPSPGYPDLRDVRSGVKEGFHDYEDHSVLPPIYKAIADHAKLKVQKLQLKQHKSPAVDLNYFDYQVKEPEPRRPQPHLHYNLGPHDDYHHDRHRDYHRHNDVDDDYPSNYAFSYKVRDHLTGDDFSHSQHSSGSATNGEYRVRLPDGRMQIVSYTADEHGYKADVRYDDEDKMQGNTLETHDDYKFGGGKHDHSDYNPNNAFIDHLKINNHNKLQHNDDDYKPRQVYQNPERDSLKTNDYKNYYHDDNLVKSDYFGKNDYSENNKENIQNDYKPIIVSDNYKPVKESKEDYNQYTDISNEYNNHDYSVEYDGRNDNFDPHHSKFSIYTPKPENQDSPSTVSSTVRPLYEELKKIFVKKNYNTPTESYKNPVEINVPSTTPSSYAYDTTTEHVVVIGTKPLYTKVANSVTPTPAIRYTTPNDLINNITPSGYLVSTIAHLRNGEKPVLSGSFIDRINKYLSF